MRTALPWLLFTGCAPTAIEVPPPGSLAVPASGPSVTLSYPIDARPAGERRDGGYYDTTVPLPLVLYGDVNVTPSPGEQVDRALEAALVSEGIPLEPGGDLQVRVFVLHHVGTFDVSDAQWVSTLTGGIAGTVGKFLYPVFVTVEGQLRLEIRDEGGEVLAVRDVEAFAVRKLPYAFTWGVWSLWRKDRVANEFVGAFTEVQARMGADAVAVIDAVRHGEAPTAGVPATDPAQHALDPAWRPADTFDLRDGVAEDAFARAKYGNDRFSLLTGHDTEKGDVVGHIGIGGETFGYEVGILDEAQARVNVTLLGLVNQAEGGMRMQVGRRGPSALSLEGLVGTDVTLLPADRYRPRLAAVHFDTDVIASARPKEVTWSYRGGANFALATATLDVDDDGVAEVVPGRILGLHTGPGAEVQLTATTLLAFRLTASAQFQGGDLLDLGPLGSIVLLPQISLGLR
jgi:hypothetical protein